MYLVVICTYRHSYIVTNISGQLSKNISIIYNHPMTTLCNVKVSNIRPKYKNLKEWMNDDQNIYIGRKGVVFIDNQRFPPNDSMFANPFKIDNNNSREVVIAKYKKYILNKINKLEITKQDLLNLKGKNLGCWCYPEKCHGNVLIEIIDSIE